MNKSRGKVARRSREIKLMWAKAEADKQRKAMLKELIVVVCVVAMSACVLALALNLTFGGF